jgi:NADH dehydrogenase (ubiquinone) 1 beta subcomplex subunit 8
MLLPRRAVCALQRGKSIQSRLISQSARRQLEPVVGKGEAADPQLGGYPQLLGSSTQERSPFGWWDTQYRRNYGETVRQTAFSLSTSQTDHTGLPRNAQYECNYIPIAT